MNFCPGRNPKGYIVQWPHQTVAISEVQNMG